MAEVSKMHFVIAQYHEDVSWADNLEKTVITKDTHLPNIGREASSYLLFILNNYSTLEGEYVFCQGNPFPHAPKFLEDVHKTNYFGDTVQCNLDGSPHHPNLPIHETLIGLELQHGPQLSFKPGCQFKLTAEQIRQKPYSFYAKLFSVFTLNDNMAYIFERLPKSIWDCLEI